MKKLSFAILSLAIAIISFSFYTSSHNSNQSNDIVLQFVTYNDYGNNLYIDNVLTGIQRDIDLTVTSILNIPYDTTYSILQSGIDSVFPQVTVSNIGFNNVSDTAITAYLSIEPGGYLDTERVSTLNTGQTVIANFIKFNYTVGTQYFLKAYVTYNSDSNHVNDTLFQTSTILPGFQRNVLYEEFTSNSSPACANNNSYLDDFINDNIQSVTAIKYHTGLLGTDSFYFANTEQNDARRRYYFVSAVPTTLADGRITVSIPYGDSSNLYNPYFTRLAKGTPVSMSVTDERVTGDSIKATIDINIISPLPPGNYRLRINAVERYIHSKFPQGTNGEKDFYDIFRRAFPDTNGIAINSSIGTYQYQYTYHILPEWFDSMMYTAAFIQNDNTREVLNCAKGRNIVLKPFNNSAKIIFEKADPLNVFYIWGSSHPKNNFSDSIQTALNAELFEAFFPPLGWEIFNLDGYITFEQYSGANGPTITGTKSVIMDFFDYNIIGQRDSMYTKSYSNLLPSDTIRFDYAYAQYTSSFIDSLIVKVSTDGGITFPYEIFRRGGLQLATAPQTTSFFIPTNNTQWRTYKFSLDGIVHVNNFSNSIPQKFTLSQNYPNPFNPKTVIQYALPVSGNIKLIVYDLLGKEIMKLVDEKQNAGEYEINFDGTNLSSGIYFYQLTTEGFSETKRMMLLK